MFQQMKLKKEENFKLVSTFKKELIEKSLKKRLNWNKKTLKKNGMSCLNKEKQIVVLNKNDFNF